MLTARSARRTPTLDRVTEPAILVVEDDASIGRGLVAALGTQGYATQWVTNAAEALDALRGGSTDLVLLDLGLPDADGVDLCRQVRAQDAALPILILTARQHEIDVVLGLDAGADDYVTKPFRLAELLARVRAHLRRPGKDSREPNIVVGDVEVDLQARRVFVAGDEIDLRAKEFDLLAFLMTEVGHAIPRERIMSEVWDEHWFGSTKTLDMHVSALRRKLGETSEADGRPSRITTLRGVGYRFELP